ncbi:MAG: response regulator [Tannerella sp.]|jgi:signal transduction histidine kinase/DNA-binding response OmpR family regulator/ligand-binding sensor domain-containing protein|nr:response regulator [Tannerella sp.]
MKYRLIGILLLWYCNLPANETFNFQTLGLKSGLSDNYIIDIAQDQYGFMWFSSTNGLNRYDGYQVKHYTIMELGAHNNCTGKVAEDQNGILWIMTPTDNYFYYNREADRIDDRISNQLEGKGIRGHVRKMFVDEDANLWCLADDTLFYYNYTKEKLYAFDFTNEPVILSLTCRQEHAYILYANGCIGKVDFNNRRINKELQIEQKYMWHTIYLDYDLNLWIYTHYPLKNSISLYDTTTGQWSYPLEKHTFDGSYAVHLTDDGNGNIWIATNNKAIFIYQPKTKQIKHIAKDKHNKYSIPDTHINRIFKDNRNIMWVATGKKGVAFTSLNHTTIESFDSCVLEDISCITEDGAGNLWFGSDGEGIMIFNPKTNHRSFFKENTIASDIVICSYKDSQNRMWIGTYGGGICYYENNCFKTLHYPVEPVTGNPLLYIRCIEEDNYGNIWFGTIATGLYCYNKQGDFTAYTTDNSILLTNSITDLSCQGDILYIATSSGLYVMNTRRGQLELLTGHENSNLLLVNMVISDICRDSRGLIWIGGQEGICIYREKQDTLISITHEKKLPVAKVRGIIEDRNNNMWITTDLGILHIVVVNDPALPMPQFRCYYYYEEDGTGNQTFNTHAIYCDAEGNILAGGTNGIIKIYPQLVQHNNYASSKIIFTAFYLSNQFVNAGDTLADGRVLLKENIQQVDNIEVKYSDNFALDVSAMNYKDMNNTCFLYRISKKEEWIRLTGNRLFFNRLPPGTHSLEVIMESCNTEWNGTPASLVIHVTPPFWMSTLAYTGYLTLALGLILYGITWKQKKQRRKLEKQRRELEISKQHEMDEAKLRFFTNVSHDLRTPLSLIITPLEKILAQPGTMIENSKEDLEVMHRNALLLMNEMNQLLDLRKLEKGESTLRASHGNLSEFVKDICRDFESFSRRKNIRLLLCIKIPELYIDFDQKKMQRILMNLLSNAFKYNTDNGVIIVTVDKILDSNGPSARIQVSDTGIGIQHANKERIFDRFYQEHHTATEYVGSGLGLHIVREYVTLHGGEIQVEENQPQGSIFTITLPIHSTEIIEDFSEEESPEEDAMEEKQVSILIVEDNEDFSTFLTNCLKEQYRVYNASNGKKALAMMSRCAIQIVISDIMMPVMDGLELCKRIKTDIRYSHIPVILLTARSREQYVVNGLKEGADDYIAKPFNLDILLLRIRKLLEWKQESHKKFMSVDVAPGEITISSLDEQLIEKCIHIVEENMDNVDFSVEKLSSSVGMSRGHLYKKLISITGKSPLEFIRIIRVKRGHQLLKKSQLSISEIAYKIGLSPKQFSIHFKNEFGCLPSNFKKESEAI